MRRYAREMAEALGPNCMVIEYGSGEGVKIRLLLEHLQSPAAYVPVDIAGDHLQDIAEQLNQDYPHLEVAPVTADFTAPFALPSVEHSTQRRAIYFPGSTLGNFTNDAATKLLASMRALAGPYGALLLGVDLVKPSHILNAAYNDQQGVTEAFNKNLLARINRELDGDFDLDQFAHEARFNPRTSRMEIYLRSLREQQVAIGDQVFRFRDQERIHTEYSHKYSINTFDQLAEPAGWRLKTSWTDANNYFAIMLLEATA